jgi:uncharacterized protein (TIGR02246 family)
MMAAQRPEDVHRLFEEAFNAADLDALVALFEPEAVTFDSQGQLAEGSQAIGEALQSFLEWKPQIKLETKSAIQVGDLALLRGEWQMKGTNPDGEPIEIGHKSSEVVRRQADGTWRFVIDHPFGAD